MAHAPGKLIMLSGIECSGKDTQVALLAETLAERGIRVKTAREPGGTPIGELIRTIVKNPAHAGTIAPLTSLFLFNAARAQFFHEIVRPTLASGIHLIVNRSFLCTVAYQGYAEGLPVEFVRTLSWEAMGGTDPDIVIHLDIPTHVMRERLAARGGADADRYDALPLAFHEKVRDGYRHEMRHYPHLLHRADGEGHESDVRDRLLNIIMPVLEAG